jgi:hypothetical protein
MKKLFIMLAYLVCSTFCKAQTTTLTTKLVTNADTLHIGKNDKRYFEATYDLKNPLKFKEVSSIVHKANTVTIEVTNMEPSGTMLKIFNPFKEQLVYKAELYSYKKNDFIETSTVSVYPEIFSYETWPYKIDRFRLTGFTLVKAN